MTTGPAHETFPYRSLSSAAPGLVAEEQDLRLFPVGLPPVRMEAAQTSRRMRVAQRAPVFSAERWSGPTMFDHLTLIDERECWELLASVAIGRLAVAESDLAPLVAPVNFVIDDGAIVFRTGSGAKCTAALRGPVSFQADSFDGMYHSGWSVLVKGHARQLLRGQGAHLAVEPWAGGDRSIWIRIDAFEVTGRRVEI